MTKTAFIIILAAVYFGWMMWSLDRTLRSAVSKVQREIMVPLSKIEAHLNYLVRYVASLEKKEHDIRVREDLGLSPTATDKEVEEREAEHMRQFQETHPGVF